VSIGWSAAAARPRRRLRRIFIEAGSMALAGLLLVWTLVPVYNMLLIALDPEEGEVEFTGNIWPPDPSLDSFGVVVTQADRYLEDFWRQFANSLVIGVLTVLLTVVISSMASFALGRLRVGKSARWADTALLAYAVPASFLIFPFYRIAHSLGLSDTLWAVIAAQVAFAIPFAVLILRQYAASIPIELDEAARVDGASPGQVYWRIYLPLTAPALMVIGFCALVLAWNDYLYQFVLLSSTRNATVAMMQAHLFEDSDAAWNAMMAAALLYALPPVAVLFTAYRYFATRNTGGWGPSAKSLGG